MQVSLNNDIAVRRIHKR